MGTMPYSYLVFLRALSIVYKLLEFRSLILVLLRYSVHGSASSTSRTSRNKCSVSIWSAKLEIDAQSVSVEQSHPVIINVDPEIEGHEGPRRQFPRTSTSLSTTEEKHLVSGRWRASKSRVRCFHWVFLCFAILGFFICLFLCVFPPLVGSQGSIDEICSCWGEEKGEGEPFRVRPKVCNSPAGW